MISTTDVLALMIFCTTMVTIVALNNSVAKNAINLLQKLLPNQQDNQDN